MYRSWSWDSRVAKTRAGSRRGARHSNEHASAHQFPKAAMPMLARILLIPSGTQRGMRESAGRGGTGLATCALREPGAECRGTFGPFFCPQIIRKCSTETSSAKSGGTSCQVPTPDGERNRGDPDFPAGVGDSVPSYVGIRRIRSSLISLRPIRAVGKRFQGVCSRRVSRS